ncbi:hypothetical protein AAFF_G00387630 [Aldrovandia affinis]|uniref:Uncharacterized protein n=1 Tax=Aldrovandia affinis TaxID=143900 RepID=A0AAD7SGU5_9TELE|nr:hypothetical protein AAFF_G00387630 [Aldrovandia affinis]
MSCDAGKKEEMIGRAGKTFRERRQTAHQQGLADLLLQRTSPRSLSWCAGERLSAEVHPEKTWYERCPLNDISRALECYSVQGVVDGSTPGYILAQSSPCRL